MLSPIIRGMVGLTTLRSLSDKIPHTSQPPKRVQIATAYWVAYHLLVNLLG